MFGRNRNKKKVEWREIDCRGMGTRTRRAKVPGGWLVAIENTTGMGLTFYPDSEHSWQVDLAVTESKDEDYSV